MAIMTAIIRVQIVTLFHNPEASLLDLVLEAGGVKQPMHLYSAPL